MMPRLAKTLSLTAFMCGLSFAAHAADAAGIPLMTVDAPAGSFLAAMEDSKAFVDARYRYETVHQDKKFDANANTLRTIAGINTGTYKGFQVQVAGLNTMHLGNNFYNDGYNNRSTFAKVGDPTDFQLHLANLTYTGIPDFKAVIGRQYIALDNQRFIGAPKWRQIPQTFDAASFTYNPIKPLELFYSFVVHANRSPGSGVTDGTYDLSTHILHASYTGIENVKLSAYSYLEDIRTTTTPAATPSTATTGIRGEGKYSLTPLVGVKDLYVTGAAEYARQNSYAQNPQTYGLNYYMFEPGVSVGNFYVKYTDETLGGGWSQCGSDAIGFIACHERLGGCVPDHTGQRFA